MSKEYGAVVLAAGQGKRLYSNSPKPMVEVGGKPIIAYPLASLLQSGFRRDEISVVTPADNSLVERFCRGGALVCEQRIPNGNLEALENGWSNLPAKPRNILVVQADDGLSLTPKQIAELIEVHDSQKAAMTLFLSNDYRPSAHRVHYVVDYNGLVVEKVPVQQMTGCLNVNAGAFCISTRFLVKNAPNIPSIEGEERTITPLVELALNQHRLSALVNKGKTIGINTPEELESARMSVNP